MIKINESNITIMVRDINKSIAFYESIGLKLKARWDDHYAMVEAPGVVIGLHPSEDHPDSHRDEESKGVSIGFMIDKADEAEELLKKNGISYKRHDDGGSGIYVYFSDPDKTVLYFTQPRWNY